TFDGPYGVYHSMYDNFYWMNKFGDPGYRYHTLMSKLWGVLALRLANAEVLPFDFAFYADNIRQFVKELQKNKDARRRFDFKPLLARVAQLEVEARKLNQAIERRLVSGKLDGRLSQQINRRIMQVEANWLNPDGIPGRPWFKHILYAARYTYAHLELPGLTEAIERSDWKAASEQGRILENALAKNVALLRAATAELAR
ncbi:MAG TPA: transferrin receptor-like dimerization domain-containing protein, partial [Blastocatellia bacterium]|nr:transferrin receptor-like dimerization domain-containing protein [Blastocatellia bacterium]